MTLNIMLGEIFVREGGALVKTRCQKKYIDDKAAAWVATCVKLDAGDLITMLCMNHERNTVYWEREYRIGKRLDFLQRSENDRGDMNYKDAFEVSVQPRTDWIAVCPEPSVLHAIDKGPVHKWWVVDQDDKPVVKGVPEDEANRIVSGELPIPVAA